MTSYDSIYYRRRVQARMNIKRKNGLTVLQKKWSYRPPENKRNAQQEMWCHYTKLGWIVDTRPILVADEWAELKIRVFAPFNSIIMDQRVDGRPARRKPL